MSQSDFVNRGQALVASGQYQEAVKVCRLGLLGRPTTVDGRVVLGQALLALKRFDEVLAEMRVAIELDHGSVPALVLKAEALLRKGDHHAAAETLDKARVLAPDDRQIGKLAAEADKAIRQPAPSTSHPSVGFVRDTSTKGYPNHQGDDDGAADHYTKPTSIASPASRDGKSRSRAAAKPPGGKELAVGDKSGTVEVDPELEGIELDSDDLGALSPPPSLGKPAGFEGPRGSVVKSSARNGGKPVAVELASRDSGEMLDADDLMDLDEETPPPLDIMQPGRVGRSAVRSAVGMMSGPLDQYPVGAQGSLAQAIAGNPHVLQVTPLAPQNGLAVPTASPRAQTMMPQQMMPLPPVQQQAYQPPFQQQMMPQPPQASPASYVAAAQPTMALSAAQLRTADAVDAMFPPPPQGPPASLAWAKSTVVAGGPNGTPGMPGQGGVDPALAALAASVDASASGQMAPSPSQSDARAMKTGMRRTRSKLRVVVWIVLGAAVIAGGVFAGFQIRAMRLANQIDSARARATALAKEDTWGGWAAARDGLAGIVMAANTGDNRAALARARASIAFELGDGLPEAKQAVDALKGEEGLDVQLATAYVTLADDDPKAAKTAADAALAAAPHDAAALYVAGRAQLLAGDASGAVAHLKAALEAEPRPLYAVGLAHAYADANAWDDGLAAAERALVLSPDNPAALIERAELDTAAGRVVPNTALGGELRGQLDKIIAEGARPLAEQPRGVSPAQVARANLALAHLQLARGDMPGATAANKAALALSLDDQGVVEGIIGGFVLLDDAAHARAAAEPTIAHWPNSRRARIELARALIALGKPDEALAAIAKSGEVTTLPLGLATRGDAKLAAGDFDGARADYDAALKREPRLEAAIIGRVALDVAAGKITDARTVIEPRFAGKDAVGSVAISTAYASVLRASGDPAQRDRARMLLERLAAGPATPPVVRAKVELARIYRDAGDLRAARDAYGEAAQAGSVDARIDNALLQIEDRDPKGGYDSLQTLLKAIGEAPPANVLLETARAAMLVGDHAGALALLDQAEKARGLVHWQLDRERGRLAFRRGDLAGAAQALTRALDACGPDAETFLLAADVVYTDLASVDDKTPAKYGELASKLTALASDRLAGRAERAIVTGILALAANKPDEAAAAYKSAGDQLDAEKASSRRRARASFGFAILAYNAHNLPDAKTQLDLVLGQDPANYSAYLYRADVLGEKKATKDALADAQQAVAYNPDLVDGWYFVGKFAHDLGDKKLLAQALTQINAIAPDSPHLRELQQLR